jgi:hypothetical protein
LLLGAPTRGERGTREETHHVVAVEQLLGGDAGQAAQHVRAGVDDDRL